MTKNKICFWVFMLLSLSCCKDIQDFLEPVSFEKDIVFDREKMNDHPNGGKVEGYWAVSAHKESSYPFPKKQGQAFRGASDFIAALEKLENHKSVEVLNFKGYSPCRFGDLASNGSEEFRLKVGDAVSWPGGYLHYIKEHHVIPSREFFRFMMNYAKSF